MGSELARPPAARPPAARRPPPFCLCTTQRFVSVQHRNCLCATQKLSLFYREHIVSGQKLAKNQELAKIGRRATVLRFAGMGEHPTGLRKPLGLFLDPKNGQFFFFAPLAPLLGVSPSGQFTLVIMRRNAIARAIARHCEVGEVIWEEACKYSCNTK